jgi:L-threonylcarbamoyladenylate synthase
MTASQRVRLQAHAELLRQGQLIVFPTETVYGLGASAWHPAAVRRIFEAKGRPADNPLIVHISSIDMVGKFAAQIPVRARSLMQKFWPGPLTLIFRKKPEVLDLITGGMDTVALRMPDHELALELIAQAGPLVAPSANKSGRPSPTRIEHVLADFGSELPIIDGGPCRLGLESTVIDMSVQPPCILRPGFITADAIEQRCGFRPVLASEQKKPASQDNSAPKSPGMKYSHYAPKARVSWLPQLPPERKTYTREELPEQSLILLHHHTAAQKQGCKQIHFGGDYAHMARELYDWFRKADIDGYTSIGIEPFGTDEATKTNALWQALYNRISKASGG